MNQKALIGILTPAREELATAPEDTLLKIASERELSPAQLEKLAQTYNTWHTLSFYDSGNDRAATPPRLVDPPALTDRYTQKEKSAHTTPLRPVHNDHSRLDLCRDLRQDFEKEAAENIVPLVAEPEAETPVTHEQIKEGALTMLAEAKMDAFAAAKNLMRVADLTAACSDARYRIGEADVLKAAAFVQKYASSARTKVQVPLSTDDLPAMRPRAFEIMSPEAEQLCKLAAALDDAEVAALALEELNKHAATAADEGVDKFKSILDAVMDSDADDATIEATLQKHGVPPELIAQTLEARRQQQADDEADDYDDDDSDAPNGYEGEARTRKKSKGGGKANAGGGGKTSGNDSVELSSLPGRAMSAVSGVAGALASTVNNGAAAATGMLSDITGKSRLNKGQLATDRSVDDIRRSVRLARLIQNDPILREQDPTKVMNAYNTLARSNPDLANEPSALLLPLREAAAYDGVTVAAQGELANLRKTTADAKSRESELARSNYESSDGGLAALLNKQS